MKKLLKISVFVLSVFIIVACADKQSTPEKTAESAIISILTVDVGTAITLTDPSELKQYGIDPAGLDSTLKADLTEKLKAFSEDIKSKGMTSDTIEISDVKYSDDKNTARLKINYPNSDESSARMTFKKIDNKWYVEHFSK